MLLNTTYRTTEEEIMDDFSLEGEELRDALDKIAAINQFLGGNQLTLQGVKQLIGSKTQKLTIVDVGCGNGDMLRALAHFGSKNKLEFNLIGIDANAFTVNHAIALSKEYSNISYQCIDIFEEEFKALQYDLLLCTLTLHHFKNDQINYLLQLFSSKAAVGIVINDLHRTSVAYRLFQLVCFVFGLNNMSREDGLVSILRGFKKEELVAFSKKNKLKNYTIHWKWAFRYQWIIKTEI
ncbi:methyltransferase domain-containing protein [Flavobacterium sp. 7A]|uniref:methyltransferase domain-containing protein n=1 Tax=Flavobacterium sp. 7A TaxID=2940571 RepID=UPI002227C980|nr:methyltransferase domain-containing protein [Flavobacterium sp. 7A]MCW2120706.1 2-polyprenyl-3-methyl-5-hydroxy-6-metoxy-1,4-benzoquinol methylase [Flavobacterium sp. 7A]